MSPEDAARRVPQHLVERALGRMAEHLRRQLGSGHVVVVEREPDVDDALVDGAPAGADDDRGRGKGRRAPRRCDLPPEQQPPPTHRRDKA